MDQILYDMLSPAEQDILTLLSGRTLEKPVSDWQKIFSIANENRVVPMIYAQIRSRGLNVPEEYLIPFARSYAATSVRNREILKALEDISSILHASGLDTVPLKGASLIHRLYDDPGLRPMSDLDLWIPSRNAYIARQILSDCGLVQPPPQKISPPPPKTAFHLKIEKRLSCSDYSLHLAPLFLPDYHDIRLEIHPALYWFPSLLPMQEAALIWKRREQVPEKKGLSLVKEEDELLILAAHLLRNREKENYILLHYMDIALALQREEWRIGAEKLHLRDAKEILGLAFSGLATPNPEPFPFLHSSSYELLFHQKMKYGMPEKTWLMMHYNRMIKILGFCNRVRYLAGCVTPSPEYIRHIYKEKDDCLLLCYLDRIFQKTRMAFRGIRRLS